jgi:alpha-D-ribose 1-methylphosphonate 5-triphosphate synthase subunit PhnH
MSAAPNLAGLRPGLADASLDSQRIFRRIMEATARPGLSQIIMSAPQPPQGLSPAAGAVLLTLADVDTPLWLDPGLVATEAEAWLRFHCGCQITSDPAAAAFALVSDPGSMPQLSAFNQGEAKYPDRATTLIIDVVGLRGGPAVVLRGPGIETEAVISPHGLPATFWSQRADVVSRFQFGVDLVLCAGSEILAIPRTTRTAGGES